MHARPDNHGGADKLLDIMKKHRLVAASTLHKPRRNHTNATFIPRDTRYRPKQLDYILCSSRWVSSVRSSRVRWGVSIQRWGRKYDHGLVECAWKAHPKAPKRAIRPISVHSQGTLTLLKTLTNRLKLEFNQLP